MYKFLNINFYIKMSSNFTEMVLQYDPYPTCICFTNSPRFKTTIN